MLKLMIYITNLLIFFFFFFFCLHKTENVVKLKFQRPTGNILLLNNKLLLPFQFLFDFTCKVKEQKMLDS